MNEVEVCYLDSKGQFESRKTKQYSTFDQASAVFATTINKFKSTNRPGLVTLRRLKNNFWILEKSERI